MIKLKSLISENNIRINTFKKELKDFIQRWRKAPDGYDKDHLMTLIKIAVAEIEKEKKKSKSTREYEHDKGEFFKHHYTGHIRSDAYTQSEKEGGLAWLGNKSKYPKLLDRGKYGNFDVEFRQTGERNKYLQRGEDGEIVRYSNGELGYMTPDEIRAEKLPEYDTKVVAFVDDKPIGFASDEFGAVGVWVEGPYQKVGIGTELLDKHIEQRPTIKSGKGKIGQMTNSGIAMTQKYYDRMAKKHGPNWFQKLKGINESLNCSRCNGWKFIYVRAGIPNIIAKCPICSGEQHKQIKVYRGVSEYNKKYSNFWTTDKEWARQFTQSGLDKEIKQKTINTAVIMKRENAPLPGACNQKKFDQAIKDAEQGKFDAFWVNEGNGEPPSIYVMNLSVLK